MLKDCLCACADITQEVNKLQQRAATELSFESSKLWISRLISDQNEEAASQWREAERNHNRVEVQTPSVRFEKHIPFIVGQEQREARPSEQLEGYRRMIAERMMERKRKPEIMQEHLAALIVNTPDNKKKKKRKREEKLGLHHVDGLTESQRKKKRRKSASQQEHPAPVNPNPHGEDLKEEEVNLSPSGGLKQCLKKTKKKRRTDEKNILLSTAELMQHQDKKKKKKKNCEEPCAAVDLDAPMKNKDKEVKEEAIPPPDGPTHGQKKKKKMEMTPAVAFEETNICSTKTKKKRGETMSQEDRKKKRTKRGDMKSTQEEEVNWVLVEELQEYMPHIKKKCLSQIKKMLGCDLQRFRKFKQQGVPARLGRFSELENQQIRENIAGFMALTGISSVEKLLFPKRFKEEQVTITRLKKEHRFMERI
ncbi:hypothetical protein CHARACLAT_021145, partial [Characodon lateralis]|nr:hypothetical protein [Characodon lateralis]